MYGKKTYGLPCALIKGLLGSCLPPPQESRNHKNWIAVRDLKNLRGMPVRHSQIYRMDEQPNIKPPIPPNCQCEIRPMREVEAGMEQRAGKTARITGWSILQPYRSKTRQKTSLESWDEKKGIAGKICTGENGYDGNLPKPKWTFTLKNREISYKTLRSALKGNRKGSTYLSRGNLANPARGNRKRKIPLACVQMRDCTKKLLTILMGFNMIILSYILNLCP